MVDAVVHTFEKPVAMVPERLGILELLKYKLFGTGIAMNYNMNQKPQNKLFNSPLRRFCFYLRRYRKETSKLTKPWGEHGVKIS